MQSLVNGNCKEQDKATVFKLIPLSVSDEVTNNFNRLQRDRTVSFSRQLRNSGSAENLLNQLAGGGGGRGGPPSPPPRVRVGDNGSGGVVSGVGGGEGDEYESEESEPLSNLVYDKKEKKALKKSLTSSIKVNVERLSVVRLYFFLFC